MSLVAREHMIMVGNCVFHTVHILQLQARATFLNCKTTITASTQAPAHSVVSPMLIRRKQYLVSASSIHWLSDTQHIHDHGWLMCGVFQIEQTLGTDGGSLGPQLFQNSCQQQLTGNSSNKNEWTGGRTVNTLFNNHTGINIMYCTLQYNEVWC